MPKAWGEGQSRPSEGGGDPSAQAKVRSAEDGEAAAFARAAPSLDGPGVSPVFKKSNVAVPNEASDWDALNAILKV